MENTNEGTKDTTEQETATTNENKMTQNSPESEIVENDAQQAVPDKAKSETKSRIRSRWYRANERPLESQSTPVANPTGEITLTEGVVLKDDLSNATPPKGGGDREDRGRDGDRRGGRDGDRRGGRDGDRRGGRDGDRRGGRDGDRRGGRDGDRRGGRDGDRRGGGRERGPKREDGDGREGQNERNRPTRDDQEKPDSEGKRSRGRSGNRNRNRSDKDGQRRDGGQGSGKHRNERRHSKSDDSTSPTQKKTDAPTNKKSGGVGKFLAGLFGGK